MASFITKTRIYPSFSSSSSSSSIDPSSISPEDKDSPSLLCQTPKKTNEISLPIFAGKRKSRSDSTEEMDLDERLNPQKTARKELDDDSISFHKLSDLEEFLEAAKSGNLEKLKKYESIRAEDFEKINIEKYSFLSPLSPLHLAVLYNQIDVIEYLVEKGFDINQRVEYTDEDDYSHRKITPLILSIISDNNEAFEKLLELGVDVNLDCSFEDEWIDFSTKDFEDGNCITHYTNRNVSPLLLACLLKKEDMVLKLLQTKRINFKDCEPPQSILKRGSTIILKKNFKMLYNYLALIFAIEAGFKKETIQAFFENGADAKYAQFYYYSLEKIKNDGETVLLDLPVTPLMIAFKFNRKDVIDILLKYGADINAQMPEGETILHRLCESREVSLDMVKYLIEKGSDVTKKNFYRYYALNRKKIFYQETALMYLCRNIELENVQECARWLIVNRKKLGINLNDVDIFKESILMKTVKRYISIAFNKTIDKSNKIVKLTSIQSFIFFLLKNGANDFQKKGSKNIYDMIDDVILHTNTKKDEKLKESVNSIDTLAFIMKLHKDQLAKEQLQKRQQQLKLLQQSKRYSSFEALLDSYE